MTVRGAGLLLGVVLEQPVAKAVEAAARTGGVLVNAATPEVIRLAPPLILSASEAQHGIDVLTKAIASALAEASEAASVAASAPDGPPEGAASRRQGRSA